MPDRMSNRMSEDMSDRMPEDLPVRKCINVMVGITRSKVICDFCPRNFCRHVGFDLPPDLFGPEIEFPLPISLSRSVSQTKDKSSIAT